MNMAEHSVLIDPIQRVYPHRSHISRVCSFSCPQRWRAWRAAPSLALGPWLLSAQLPAVQALSPLMSSASVAEKHKWFNC